MAKSKKRALPPMTAAVKARLESISYALDALPAICAIEGVDEVTTESLELLGIGGSGGVVLMDCVDPEAAARHRLLYSKALITQDAKLIGIAGGDSDASKRKNTEMALCRMLAGLARSVMKSQAAEATPVQTAGTTAYVTMQTEEERGYSLTEYTSTDVKEARAVLIKMNNLIIRGHLVAAIGLLKKVGYWVKNERSVPDPKRVPLKSWAVLQSIPSGHLTQLSPGCAK